MTAFAIAERDVLRQFTENIRTLVGAGHGTIIPCVLRIGRFLSTAAVILR